MTTGTPGERRLGVDDVSALAAGAGLLGSGGGGDVAVGARLLRHLLQDGAHTRLVQARNLPADTLVVHIGLAGAPDVVAERPPGGEDFANAVVALAGALRERVGAIGVIEIGGLNALIPLVAAQVLGLPVVDGDLMGRAFPRISQTTLAAAGHSATPMAVVGAAGDSVIIESPSIDSADRLMRANVAALGGAAAVALYPCRADTLAVHGLPGSVTACLALGQALAAAAGLSVSELAARLGGELLCEGRVDEIRPRRGDTPGSITVMDRSAGHIVRVDMLDEYLNAAIDGASRASAPDVLVVMDPVTFVPVPPDRLRSGQSIALLCLRPIQGWPAGSEGHIGLAAFGIDSGRPGAAP
ncbi:DUF917 domain-containing protein [Arthrobacter sp. CJ23]|uniref:DUF917 domain-containing protein n=1 Tax=Arthrobacter sp. CJ23 TaxID=2972479 RepID=UPI00215B7842|nr:DUF917 domain-containing protein [Arthrobacter sp. CJ23]UVJ38917.1 DUF917 domain-containing protein [Arthrobacter sp. CJ23]